MNKIISSIFYRLWNDYSCIYWNIIAIYSTGNCIWRKIQLFNNSLNR